MRSTKAGEVANNFFAIGRAFRVIEEFITGKI